MMPSAVAAAIKSAVMSTAEPTMMPAAIEAAMVPATAETAVVVSASRIVMVMVMMMSVVRVMWLVMSVRGRAGESGISRVAGKQRRHSVIRAVWHFAVGAVKRSASTPDQSQHGGCDQRGHDDKQTEE